MRTIQGFVISNMPLGSDWLETKLRLRWKHCWQLAYLGLELRLWSLATKFGSTSRTHHQFDGNNNNNNNAFLYFGLENSLL